MKYAKSSAARIISITAILLIASLILAYLVGMATIASHQKIASQRAILQHLEQTVSTLKDAETGQRGYLLTGDERYLEPYHQALAQIHSEQETLRQLAATGDLPNLSVQSLLRLSDEKLAELDQTIQLRGKGDLGSVLPVVRTGEGKATMDKIRAEIERMSAGEDQELQQALERANSTVTFRTVTFFLMAIVNLGVLAWAHRRIQQDIRAREAAILETHRQEQLLSTTLASIGDGVIATDAQGHVTFLNPEAERLTGWKNSDAAGQPLSSVFRIVNEQTREPLENPVDKVLRHNLVVGLANHTLLLSKDGREIPIDDSAAPIRQLGGPIFGVVLVFRDFRERKQADAALQALSLFPEQNPAPILRISQAGTLLYANPAARKNLQEWGLVTGQAAPAEVFSLASAALSAGRPVERELMVATRNYLIGVVPILDSGYANLYWMDVTERKRAEDEIRSLNEQLRQRLEEMTLLLDLLPVGVWIGNHDCSEIRGNAAGYRIFGLTTGINASVTAAQPELPAGLRIRVNGMEVPPEELPMQKVARTGQPWNNFEHDITFPDGTIKTVYGSVAPLFDERGEVRQVIGAYAEFTERKKAQEALAEATRQQEALYQCVDRLHRAESPAEIYDAALDAILKALRCHRASVLFYDDAGVMRFVAWRGLSDSYRLATEGHSPWTREEANPQPLCVPNVAASEMNEALKSIVVKEGISALAFVPLVAHGELIGKFMTYYDTPHLFHDQELELALSIARQVALSVARKRAEEALRENEQRLDLALRASGAVPWGWNVRENFLDESTPQYRDLYGFAPEEPVTFEMWRKRVHPSDEQRLRSRLRDMLTTPGDDNWQEEFRILHPTRGERWIGGPGRCLRDEAGLALRLAGVNLDITDRKRSEIELRSAKAELERANQELEERVERRTAKLQEMVAELQHLSYAITHDMRAPLRAMSAFSAVMLEELARAPQTSTTLLDYCRRIIAAADRLDKLIHDSLNYTKVVLQELPLEPVPLSKLLPSLIETYPNLQPDKADITIEDPLPTVLGEESLLTQCFSNLLGNAVKFVPTGTRPRVRVRAGTSGAFLRITIEDNGIGIPPQGQTRLFRMFERLTGDYEGTGVGLAIVRKVVQRMGGRVGAESEPNKGSRFWVELRLAPGQDNSVVMH